MKNDVWEEAREWNVERRSVGSSYNTACLIIQNLIEWKDAHDKQPVVDVVVTGEGQGAKSVEIDLKPGDRVVTGRYRKEVE